MTDLTSVSRVGPPRLPNSPAPNSPAPKPLDRDAQLRRASEQLETSFLSEMLKSAGLDGGAGDFGGGIGEEQFSSYLREQQAQMMVRAGGIGLAETLFQAMKGH